LWVDTGCIFIAVPECNFGQWVSNQIQKSRECANNIHRKIPDVSCGVLLLRVVGENTNNGGKSVSTTHTYGVQGYSFNLFYPQNVPLEHEE